MPTVPGRPPFWTTRTSGFFAFACVQPSGSSFEKTLGVAVRNDISDDHHRLLAFGNNESMRLGIGSQNVPLQVSPSGSGYSSSHGSKIMDPFL